MSNLKFKYEISKFKGASFSNAVLKQLTIKESDFSDAIFENAILEKVKIEESNMHNVTFGNFSRLEGIKIYKSDLSHVIFENCYILDSMLKKIVIAYGSFENIKIENCDLTDSDFSYSTMTGLLQQSVCINSQFIKCNFKGETVQIRILLMQISAGLTLRV